MIDTAYWYPAPFWTEHDSGSIKTTLLFFDEIAILLPDYMYGRHLIADPSLAEPLEDLGLLAVLEPKDWVDETVQRHLTDSLLGLLSAGACRQCSRDQLLRGALSVPDGLRRRRQSG